MKKIILIGKTGSGKTTLIQRIESQEIKYKKTQSIESHYFFIDTPGEYLENRGYYGALITTAVDADVIGLVEDCTTEDVWLPPMLSSAFAKDTIGIITKMDMAADDEMVQKARKRLEDAGAAEIFEVSAVENFGIEEIRDYINQ